MVSAIWKDTTIATSDETVVVEGNHYFPPSAVDLSLLEMSEHTSVCPIKGIARYFHIRVGSALNANAAWTYPTPNPGSEGIRDHIAFWKGVDVASQTGQAAASLMALCEHRHDTLPPISGRVGCILPQARCADRS